MSSLFGPEGYKPADAPANASSTGTLNPGGPGNSALQIEIDEQARRSQLGANWFFWIAGLSLVNSVVVLMNGRWSFLAGLGITQFIDGLAVALSPKLGNAATVLALLLDLVTVGVIVLFGLMARQRHTWAFVLGLILYAADGLLFLIVQDWLGLAFHAYASYRIFRGLTANKRLKELQLEAGLST
jgi:hypothetical protein